MEVHHQENETTELKTSFSYALPEPEFKTVGEGFQVTVFSNPEETPKIDIEGLSEGLSEGLKTLFTIIKENVGIKAKDAQVLLGNRPIKTIERQIAQLTEKGLIERRGSKKTGGYFLTEKNKNI